MTQTTAVLIARKTERVTREGLAEVPTLAPQGRRHHPRPFSEVLNSLTGAVAENGLTILDESLALTARRSRLMGVMRVAPVSDQHHLAGYQRPDASFALGWITSQDRSVSLRVISGLSVTVCTNLLLAGSFKILSRRHVHGLDLDAELRVGVTKYIEQQAEIVAETDRARQLPLTDDEARIIVCRSVETGMIAPRYVPGILQGWFSPEAEWSDCAGKSRWHLHNAYSRALREASMPVRMRVTPKLASLLRPGFPDTN